MKGSDSVTPCSKGNIAVGGQHPNRLKFVLIQSEKVANALKVFIKVEKASKY